MLSDERCFLTVNKKNSWVLLCVTEKTASALQLLPGAPTHRPPPLPTPACTLHIILVLMRALLHCGSFSKIQRITCKVGDTHIVILKNTTAVFYAVFCAKVRCGFSKKEKYKIFFHVSF